MWLWIANGQISSIFFAELSARDTSFFSFPDDNLSKYQWICITLDMCIDIVEIWFGIANGHIPQKWTFLIQEWFIKIFVCNHKMWHLTACKISDSLSFLIEIKNKMNFYRISGLMLPTLIQ